MKHSTPLFTTLLLSSLITLHAEDSFVYKKAGDRELKLFIEKPSEWKAEDRRPAIVFFFGGGWVGGTPTQFLKQSEYLATRGMVGIRVEYRTIPKGDKGPPVVCCADAKRRYAMCDVMPRNSASILTAPPRRAALQAGISRRSRV